MAIMRKKTRILLVFGTRPEAIKIAPIYKKLTKNSEEFDTFVCVTGQHRQMLDQIIDLFSIGVDFDLNLMIENQSIQEFTGKALQEITKVIEDVKPELVLVHGDTTTTLCAAMAAFFAGYKVGHIEAGLRTFDLNSPFPEEFNRQTVSKLASYHFAPTNQNRLNLLNEGVAEEKIVVTGNTAIDCLRMFLDDLASSKTTRDHLLDELEAILGFHPVEERFVLITGHRRENFGDGLLNVCRALKDLSIEHSDTNFVFPVHLNPNVLHPVRKQLKGRANIKLIDPQRYDSFVLLLHNCAAIITDSGGIQEEAPSLGKPIFVTRENTERGEAIETGVCKLVGTDSRLIFSSVSEAIRKKPKTENEMVHGNPFGDGYASDRIVEILRSL